MDFSNNIRTLEERDLILSEIEFIKRRDLDSIRNNTKEFISSIKNHDEFIESLKKIEIIKIIIAIEPTVGILNSIDEFFKTKLGIKVIFDIEVDKNIIGGIQIVYRGIYADFSVLGKININS